MFRDTTRTARILSYISPKPSVTPKSKLATNATESSQLLNHRTGDHRRREKLGHPAGKTDKTKHTSSSNKAEHHQAPRQTHPVLKEDKRHLLANKEEQYLCVLFKLSRSCHPRLYSILKETQNHCSPKKKKTWCECVANKHTRKKQKQKMGRKNIPKKRYVTTTKRKKKKGTCREKSNRLAMIPEAFCTSRPKKKI